MPRFLLLLAAHLLSLAALLGLGFWYARADARQVQQFINVEDALQRENARQRAANRELVRDIELKAGETKISKDSLRFQIAKAVVAVTADVRSALHGVREDLLARSGGQTEAGLAHNPRAEVAVARFLTEDSPEFHLLSTRVDSFIARVHYYQSAAGFDSLVHNLAFPPDRWSRLREYGGMPVAGMLAELARREQFVLQAEHAALAIVSGVVRSELIRCCFGGPDAVVSNSPQSVKSGELYEAELFLFYYCSTPHITTDSVVFEGEQLKANYGKTRVEIITQLPPTGADAWGNARQRWQATQHAIINRKDTTFRFAQEYVISTPRLDITMNGEHPVLYRHCANPLRLRHQLPPPTGTTPQNFLQVEGGRLVGAGELSAPWVLAEAPVVKVHVRDVTDGSRVQTETFRTVEPPPPGLRLWQGDSVVSLRRGVAAHTAAITVRAEAEEGFKATCPAEARYQAQGRLTLYHRGKPLGTPQPFRNSQPADLRQLAHLAQSGDWYVVEVQRCERINSVGEVWPVSNRRYEPVIVPLY
jgi:hypothetical protein